MYSLSRQQGKNRGGAGRRDLSGDLRRASSEKTPARGAGRDRTPRSPVITSAGYRRSTSTTADGSFPFLPLHMLNKHAMQARQLRNEKCSLRELTCQ